MTVSNEDRYIAELEDKVRFFTSAYGIEEGTPYEIIHASTGVLRACANAEGVISDDVKRVMRHVIAQGSRAERADAQVKKLHETLLNVSQVVANALESAAQPDQPKPPLWLLALGSNLDMVLADAALEKR